RGTWRVYAASRSQRPGARHRPGAKTRTLRWRRFSPIVRAVSYRPRWVVAAAVATGLSMWLFSRAERDSKTVGQAPASNDARARDRDEFKPVVRGVRPQPSTTPASSTGVPAASDGPSHDGGPPPSIITDIRAVLVE